MTQSADLREQFGLRLGKIARLWRARIDQHLEPFGLTEARWRTLLYLSRAKCDVRQTDLAFASGVRGPTLVRVLDRLESEGLIERRNAKDDLRVKTVHLGLGAKPVLKQIKRVAEAVRGELFVGVSDVELHTCLAVFAKITAALEVSERSAQVSAQVELSE